MDVLPIVALWLAFAGTHLGLSSRRLRPRIIDAIGPTAFQGVYSLIALGIFVALCAAYFGAQHAGPHLWYWGHAAPVRWIGYAGVTLALALLVGGILTPSPASIVPGRGEIRGALRITRHPVFMAAGLFGLFHLLVANVNAAELAFFAGFPLFAVAGCHHQDLRKAASDAGYREFCRESPFLPFTGAGTLRGLREMPVALAVAVAAALAIRAFHARWFGGVDWLAAGL